ncbi:MAG TPA: amino acid adenylation domain-containing protein [Ktedonobacteraceae bacterium]|jgi:glutamate-1-semialdehyde-2,1-aminomutase
MTQQDTFRGERSAQEIQDWLIAQICQLLDSHPVELDPRAALSSCGISSAQAVTLSGDLAGWLQRPLSPTLLWMYPTIETLAQYLASGQASAEEAHQLPLAGSWQEPIALVGIGCRFPGASNPQEFWQLLHGGECAIRDMPEERRNLLAAPLANAQVPRGGFLDRIDQFAASFFALSPREAVSLDPQQRLVLEVSWEALEYAGYAADQLAGSRSGVFLGVSSSDYLQVGRAWGVEPTLSTGTGVAHSIIANRLSYFLNLHGPSVAVDTACSSSLVALHLACQSLRLGECELALAGGVNVLLDPGLTRAFEGGGMLAADGYCKTFDARADGYVRSEGCGIVVLKGLRAARADGDNILALIRGSAINQDGASNGLTAPNGLAQQAVLRAALHSAGVEPARVSYLETHGTGTPLGDPVEVEALKTVLSEGRTAQQPCALGSVKTNIGHLEAAAGIAGLIKVVLSLQEKRLVPHLHLQQLNPHITLEHTPFCIATTARAWQQAEGARLAGVSSFGFGGTNAHVVLEEAPYQPPPFNVVERPEHLLTLSAKSESALTSLARTYEEQLASQAPDLWPDTCFTANTGRAQMPYRLALSAASATQAAEHLRAWRTGQHTPALHTGHVRRKQVPDIVFLFSGQGSVYPEMGRRLYETQPVFHQAVERCREIVRPLLSEPLTWILYTQQAESEAWQHSQSTQLALYVLQYALCELWRSWGVEPAAVLGHSLGAYAAASVAGILSLEDALLLVVERSRLISTLPRQGCMAAVFASAQTVTALLEPLQTRVVIAAFNGPTHTVISGQAPAVQEIIARASQQGIATRLLQTPFAFHSPCLDPVLEAFEQTAARIEYAAARIPFVSDTTGQFLTLAPDAHYWRQHLRYTVRFSAGLECLATYPVFLEIGPAVSLVRAGREILRSEHICWLSSLRAGCADWQVLLRTLGQLSVRGLRPDWQGFERGLTRRRVVLPTYPFERQRYWIGQPAGQHSPISVQEGTAMPHKEVGGSPLAPAKDQSMQDTLLTWLKDLLARQLDMDTAAIDPEASFLELGADSLVLLQILQTIRSTFHIPLALGLLFEKITTLRALAAYIAEQAPAASVPEPPVSALPLPSIQAPALSAQGSAEQVLTYLLSVHSQVMTRAFEILRPPPEERRPVSPAVTDAPDAGPSQVEAPGLQEAFVPFQPVVQGTHSALQPRQQQYLAAFIAQYTRRTARSKQQAARDRGQHADIRHVLNFRPGLKELCYPLVATHAAGAHLWDLDGNAYIDLTMGFGVNFFGHSEPWITAAISEQLERGIQVGPQSPLAGELAALICELTGMERVLFCNTGSEAVMTAVRLARAVSGRSKIALFSGSYHGSADPVLVRAELRDGVVHSVPLAPGIPESVAGQTIILTYGSEQSLRILREQLPELAAVLVEPVQSRRPDLQPRAFLREVRQMTREAGVALIFDEVITGFRIHPAGAQAYFGIQADLAIYGKIIGGGLPVGAVAGRAAYLDAVDGGQWAYGDASYPRTPMTFFSGTFCKHPLAMAAGHAVLTRMKQEGPLLQERLNQRVAHFASRLNAYFTEERLPLQISTCGSLFRFRFSFQTQFSEASDLFYYALLDKGIYIWEGRNCFLSPAHSQQDIERIIEAVKETVAWLQAGEFLPARPADPGACVVTMPLSAAQQQYWMLDQLGNVGFETVTLQLRGPLQIALLRQAIEQLVARHEALRTTIERTGERQRIAAACPVDLPLIDLSQDATRRPARVLHWLEEEGRRPFDLVQGPLVRFSLLCQEAQWHILVLTAHHIVVDGWSLGVLAQDIGALYTAAWTGRPCQLPPPLQFQTYLARQQALLQSAEMDRHRQYWLGQCAAPLPVLQLPTDHPRPPVRSYRGARQQLTLDSQVAQALRRVSGEQGCTLFMTLCGVYCVLLHRLSEQDDLLLGFPTSGRVMEGSEHLVGYCAHLLPLRSQLMGNPTWAHYLAQLRQRLLDAYEHQEYPYAQLLNELQLPRDPGRLPLVHATFNLERPLALPRLGDVHVTLTLPPVTHAEFDLHLNVVQQNEGLQISVDYSSDLFAQDSMQRFLARYQRLLLLLLSDQNQRVRSYDLLTEDERQHLLGAWNETRTPSGPASTFPEHLSARVQATPDAIALVAGQMHLTYAELERRSNQLAHLLRARGVRPETPVAVALQRSVELVISLLGILKAAGAFVPLDPTYPRARQAFLLADSQAPLVITETSLRAQLPAEAAVLCLDGAWPQIAAQAVTVPPQAIVPEQLAYIIYTSGSTGTPKGTMLTHRGLHNYLCWCLQAYPLNQGWGAPAHAPIGADMAITSLFVPLLAGRTVLLAAEQHPALPVSLVQQRPGSSLLKVTPAHLLMFAHLLSPREAKEATAALIVGGEQLPGPSLAFWRAHAPGTRIFNEYGPTETVVGCCVHEVSPLEEIAGVVPIGRPIANMRLYVLDRLLYPLPIGAVGELYIGGAGLGRGYLHRPDLTAASFVPDPLSPDPGQRLYRSGDLARYRPDGLLELVGRRDQQIKLRGFRVEPGEIEAALREHPAITAAAVQVRVQEQRPEDARLIAFVTTAQPLPDFAQLRQWLGRRLPEYMLPNHVVTLDALPLSVHGKIDRQALSALDLPRTSALASEQYVAPRTPLEADLARAWGAVLGVERVGIHDNFFALGGNSLLATRLITRLPDRLRTHEALRQIFTAPTIAGLSVLLEATEQEGEPTPALSKRARSTRHIAELFAAHEGGQSI